MKCLVILGRQPELSLAELESCYEQVSPFSSEVAVVKDVVDLSRLGGALKSAEVLTELKPEQSGNLMRELERLALKQHQGSTGKLKIGLSVYGDKFLAQRLQRQLLTLKRGLKAKGVSCRIVPAGSDGVLNAAKVWHNRLDSPGGVEFLVCLNNRSLLIGKTTAVQNIERFTKRDREKPVRDAKVGMLPPKLARLMINLAQAPKESLILDPFCGTGTVLMEALELGYETRGSDLDPRMVKAAQTNLEWYSELTNTRHSVMVEEADAATHRWEAKIGAVVAEIYLGEPMAQAPSDAKLERVMSEVNGLLENTLTNLASQIPSSTPLVLAVPAWFVNNRPKRLPIVDYLEKFEYNRQEFKYADQPLIYRRPEQVVGRELLVLKRK